MFKIVIQYYNLNNREFYDMFYVWANIKEICSEKCIRHHDVPC